MSDPKKGHSVFQKGPSRWLRRSGTLLNLICVISFVAINPVAAQPRFGAPPKPKPSLSVLSEAISISDFSPIIEDQQSLSDREPLFGGERFFRLHMHEMLASRGDNITGTGDVVGGVRK